jgi:hypothetical protein
LSLLLSQLHKTSGVQVWRGSAVATTATRILAFGWTFYLVMVWTFCLDYGLNSFLGTLALERDTISWLAIGFKVCFQNYFVC